MTDPSYRTCVGPRTNDEATSRLTRAVPARGKLAAAQRSSETHNGTSRNNADLEGLGWCRHRMTGC